jgi:hypothetical protein
MLRAPSLRSLFLFPWDQASEDSWARASDGGKVKVPVIRIIRQTTNTPLLVMAHHNDFSMFTRG